MLIALTVIMAVVTVATGIFQPLVAEQQVDVLKANLRVIRQALFEFYNENSRYPFEGQDEYGNVVTFLDDNTSELVQGPHSSQGKYPDQESGGRKRPRRRYLVSMPSDPTLETNQLGWKLIFRETFNVDKIAREELLKISGFESGVIVDWIVANRPFRSASKVMERLSDDLKPVWGRAYAVHDVRFGDQDPLRTRTVTNVKSLNPSYAEL